MVEASISYREKQIAQDRTTSVGLVCTIRSNLSLPHDLKLKGLTVVDLGAGASPLTAELLQAGVNAHAVDWLYFDNHALANKLEEYTTGYFKRLANNPAGQRLLRNALEVFIHSYHRDQDHYHPAYLTSLPFPDNFSDLTISHNSLTYLAEDHKILEQATREAIRITKPGKRVTLYPLYAFRQGERQFFEEHERLLRQIQQEGLGLVQRVEVAPLDYRVDIIVGPLAQAA